MFLSRSALCAVLPLAISLWAGEARADLILRHPPPSSPGSGPASDTLFMDAFGNPTWGRVADDLRLASPASINRVTWLGFFGGTFNGDPNPPTGDETMRVRFYAARPNDGLPDVSNIPYEEGFLNPSRVWTGRTIGLQREYIYSVDLSASVALAGNATYWFEAVQVGDVDSTFRWEYSRADQNGHAGINPGVPDWGIATTSDLAFELYGVPEPGVVVLVAAGLAVVRALHFRGGSAG